MGLGIIPRVWDQVDIQVQGKHLTHFIISLAPITIFKIVFSVLHDFVLVSEFTSHTKNKWFLHPKFNLKTKYNDKTILSSFALPLQHSSFLHPRYLFSLYSSLYNSCHFFTKQSQNWWLLTSWNIHFESFSNLNFFFPWGATPDGA